MGGAMDGEFQEADILWPDTPLDAFAPSEPYEAGSVPSGAPAFGRRFEVFFLRSLSSAGAGPVAEDDEEEWQEADVLWPDSVDEAQPGSGGRSPWPFRGGFGRAGRRVKPAAAPWHDGLGTEVSSPIDIPANVAARRRL